MLSFAVDVKCLLENLCRYASYLKEKVQNKTNIFKRFSESGLLEFSLEFNWVTMLAYELSKGKRLVLIYILIENS